MTVHHDKKKKNARCVRQTIWDNNVFLIKFMYVVMMMMWAEFKLLFRGSLKAIKKTFFFTRGWNKIYCLSCEKKVNVLCCSKVSQTIAYDSINVGDVSRKMPCQKSNSNLHHFHLIYSDSIQHKRSQFILLPFWRILSSWNIRLAMAFAYFHNEKRKGKMNRPYVRLKKSIRQDVRHML